MEEVAHHVAAFAMVCGGLAIAAVPTYFTLKGWKETRPFDRILGLGGVMLALVIGLSIADAAVGTGGEGDTHHRGRHKGAATRSSFGWRTQRPEPFRSRWEAAYAEGLGAGEEDASDLEDELRAQYEDERLLQEEDAELEAQERELEEPERTINPAPIKENGEPSYEFEPEDIERAEDAPAEVREYCAGAVSEAQEVGCLSHVEADEVP
jgi:hypothetical protein